jgi:kinesin family protein 4/21/27
MRQVATPAKLIYPPSAHDYAYYKASTVAFFIVDELRGSLQQVLCRPSQG